MYRITPTECIATTGFAGTGTVTRAMACARARELARLAGFDPPHVRQSDYEQARRELTGESDFDRQDAVLEALPEVKRWHPGGIECSPRPENAERSEPR